MFQILHSASGSVYGDKRGSVYGDKGGSVYNDRGRSVMLTGQSCAPLYSLQGTPRSAS